MTDIVNWFWFFAGFGCGWAFHLMLSLLLFGDVEHEEN
jgi:hypothetical protein